MPRITCQWCGWLNGEHASACAWRKFMAGEIDQLNWFPGRYEPDHHQHLIHQESAVKLDCEE